MKFNKRGQDIHGQHMIECVPNPGENITKLTITPIKRPIGLIFYLNARYGLDIPIPELKEPQKI